MALAEIELCGELMIAASAVDGERLSPARIDEVLWGTPDRPAARRTAELSAPRPRPTASAASTLWAGDVIKPIVPFFRRGIRLPKNGT
ncbi:hypothetical protein ACFQ60_24220 [Streptomyces zhihengii]